MTSRVSRDHDTQARQPRVVGLTVTAVTRHAVFRHHVIGPLKRQRQQKFVLLLVRCRLRATIGSSRSASRESKKRCKYVRYLKLRSADPNCSKGNSTLSRGEMSGIGGQ